MMGPELFVTARKAAFAIVKCCVTSSSDHMTTFSELATGFPLWLNHDFIMVFKGMCSAPKLESSLPISLI